MLRTARTVRAITDRLTLPDYRQNETLRLAVERALEIIGEAASHISPEFRQQHPEIPWRTIVAQRNVLIHGYNQVQDERIWDVVERDMPALISQLEPLVSRTDES
jgi:uncharacterized protein with HEPN domain